MRRFTASTVRPIVAATAALGISASSALAGGLEVREQSTFFQGMSFAGAAAAGDSLSSMFWNPATASIAKPGLTTESNFALIVPRSDLTLDSVFVPPAAGGPATVPCGAPADCTADIGRDAIVPASYLAWRYDSKTVLALGMNSQFGLATKPDNASWAGATVGQASKVFSLNITPTVAYEIMPGLSIGAGIQIQYIDLKRFKAAIPGAPFTPPGLVPGGTANTTLSDIDVGFTLGVNFKPTRTTSIGIGYRSKISHDLEGSTIVPTLGGPLVSTADVALDTPEKVTGSFRQELGDQIRILGTVEWVNWSRADVHPILINGGPSPAAFDFQWEDGWFFSLGGEYDVNDKLTIRAGGAYEISPIREPSQRLIQVPDADRIWASIGATYKWNDQMSFDFAYSHVFVEEENFSRIPSGQALAPANQQFIFNGSADSSVDIVSVGVKMNLPPLE